MNGFFKRNRDGGLERELRRHRPEPQDSFVRSLGDRIQEGARPVRSRPLRGRLALLGAATAVMLAGLGAFGGMSYAASAARTVAVEMKAVVTPVADPNKSGGGRDNGSGDNHGGGGGDHGGAAAATTAAAAATTASPTTTSTGTRFRSATTRGRTR